MKKEIILIVLLCLAVFQAHSQSSLDQEYSQYRAKHGKSYTQHETRYRIQMYLKNKAKIDKHNTDSTQTWQMGVTKFSDLSHEEFIYTHLTLVTPTYKPNVHQASNQDLVVDKKKNLNTDSQTVSQTPIVGASATPVNWTALGKTTSVKDQGSCGSCYSFSAVAAIESAYLIQKNLSLSLSNQQIVDCSGNSGNYGCDGGWPSNSFVYVINNNITTEALYPYTASAGKCQGNGGKYRISSYKSPYSCTGLINEIAKRPLVVEVDATNWYLYSNGVFNSCSSTVSINHGVTLAGVDANANWWIKNSWGIYWGRNGYILLAAGNTCGICKYPGYSPYL